ncbi:MAG: pyridoxal phosphate-dependent decarboxylase family protein [Phycisphaerae bacterium]
MAQEDASPIETRLGRDMEPGEFRAALHRAADMVADYLGGVERYSVVPNIAPGDVRAMLPTSAPREPEPIERVFEDYAALIEPNVTHWNHPGFMGYFAISGSGPGIIGETLAAGLNVNTMLWRSGPASTELEEVVCDWLRQWMGLPAEFRGHINDTASMSTVLGLAVARHRLQEYDIRQRGMAGRSDLPAVVVYCSPLAHSSVDKACLLLGIGLSNLYKVEVDEQFRMKPAALRVAIERDIAAGKRPMAIVSSVGTTSATSIDPTPEIAAIAREFGVWLHVDAAYAGSAAICPELRERMPGLELADSLVTNPHKWLAVPVDCSILYVRDLPLLKGAFSHVAEYLRTGDGDVTNLMDLGVQLGRRFRSLKMWFVMRTFGLSGLQAMIREHCRIAVLLDGWVRGDARFEVAAPTTLSLVCFRAVRGATIAEQNAFNERLMGEVNAAGPVLLSHTKLGERYVLRCAIGNIRTEQRHVELVWLLVREAYERLSLR